jgi:hypothetical protein
MPLKTLFFFDHAASPAHAAASEAGAFWFWYARAANAVATTALRATPVVSPASRAKICRLKTLFFFESASTLGEPGPPAAAATATTPKT